MKGGQKYFTRKRIFTRRKKKTRELWVGLYTEPGLLSCCSWIVRSNTAHLTVCSCCVYTYIYIYLSVCLPCLYTSFLPERAKRNTRALLLSTFPFFPSQTSLDFFGPIRCVCVCVYSDHPFRPDYISNPSCFFPSFLLFPFVSISGRFTSFNKKSCEEEHLFSQFPTNVFFTEWRNKEKRKKKTSRRY